MKTTLDKIKNYIKVNKYFLLGLVVAAIIVASGFSHKMYKINQCNSTVTKYVTAEFSETTYGMDFEGNPTSDTSYWSEPASEVNSISVYDSMPEYPPMPIHDTSANRDSDFDNFKFHTDAKTDVYASIPGETTHFSVDINKAASCLNKLDDVAIVKTWYTITYGSDF